MACRDAANSASTSGATILFARRSQLRHVSAAQACVVVPIALGARRQGRRSRSGRRWDVVADGLVGAGLGDRGVPDGEVSADGLEHVRVLFAEVISLAQVGLEVVEKLVLTRLLTALAPAHILPLAIDVALVVRREAVEEPAHASVWPRLTSQRRHGAHPVEAPVLLLLGPVDVEHLHDRGQEVGGDHEVPGFASGALDHAGPGDDAGDAVAAFPDVALAAAKLARVAGAAEEVRLVAEAVVAVLLGPVVRSEPDHGFLVVALLVEHVQDSAHASIELVHARVEVELRIAELRSVVTMAVVTLAGLALLAPLPRVAAADEGDVTVVEGLRTKDKGLSTKY